MKITRCLDEHGKIHFVSVDAENRAFRLEGDPFGTFQATGEEIRPEKWLPPLQPAQILCTGLNYRNHAEETGSKFPQWPVLFMKGVNTVAAHGDPIEIPAHLPSHEVDYECELAVIIKHDCKNVPRDKALDYVLGYTCANDVSARDWQRDHGGGQWCRGKTFDTFAPLGPWIVTADEIPNPNALAIRTIVNGETLQDWNTSDMIFDVARLIEFFSGSTTLPAGTVILTGTPSGVGMARKPPRWLQAGDEVTIEIEKIGKLTNPVVREPAGK